MTKLVDTARKMNVNLSELNSMTKSNSQKQDQKNVLI